MLCRYSADERTCRLPCCTKYKNDTKALAPGLFVVHCMKCSGCLGFNIMERHESPRSLFDILYTRWKSPPDVVVYDNGCNAHAYVLKREPAWAANTLFLIDKLHYMGHKACSLAYDIARYPLLGKLNSQLAEQRVGGKWGAWVLPVRTCLLAYLCVLASGSDDKLCPHPDAECSTG